MNGSLTTPSAARHRDKLAVAVRSHATSILVFLLGMLLSPTLSVQAQTNSVGGVTAVAHSNSNSISQSTWTAPPDDTNITADFNVVASNNTSNAALGNTNEPGVSNGQPDGMVSSNVANAKLQLAIYCANSEEPDKAETMFVDLLAANIPEPIQKEALYQLAGVVANENDLARAQSIYGQYIEKWPTDLKVPEALLKQGEIFRRMGLNELALGKFYSVMTAALSLKGDQIGYYRNLVLQTQVEIAETHYLSGEFTEAADFYRRVLLNTDPALNRSELEFRLIRSLAMINDRKGTIGKAKEFLDLYPNADEVPEVRYYLAQSLKALGQNAEALQQVLLCLQEQKSKTRNNPQVWAYWQQRVGNEIANQLYHEGDFTDSLTIYQNLLHLDPSLEWQVPVEYQIGLTYERLAQPGLAIQTYQDILNRHSADDTNGSTALNTIFQMSTWRLNFVQWQTNAENMNGFLVKGLPPAAVANFNAPGAQKP